MAKAYSPSKSALPPLPNLQAAAPDVVVQPVLDVVMPDVVVQPASTKTEVARTPRTARIAAAKGFAIHHRNGGIVFYPGIPSAEVVIDPWIENQIKHGTLVEV